MNRKERRKLKRLRSKNGNKRESNPYFVANSGGMLFDIKPAYAICYNGQGGKNEKEYQ